MGNVRIADKSHTQLPAVVALGLVLLTGSGMMAAASYAGNVEEARLACFVSILPQVYFVERIGGDHVTVEAMVGPGQSPETYEPTAKQLTRLYGAR
ncbi:MAG: zinc ABC transporter substrate-binding protein, partial [Candidatus Latescibacterota bacterium]